MAHDYIAVFEPYRAGLAEFEERKDFGSLEVFYDRRVGLPYKQLCLYIPLSVRKVYYISVYAGSVGVASFGVQSQQLFASYGAD